MNNSQFPDFTKITERFEARIKELEDKLQEEKTIIGNERIEEKYEEKIKKAKNDFAKKRIDDIESSITRNPLISEKMVLAFVLVVSAATFGSTGHQINKIIGNKDSNLGQIVGWGFGGLVGFLADKQGRRFFTSKAMNDDYKKQLKLLEENK